MRIKKILIYAKFIFLSVAFIFRDYFLKAFEFYISLFYTQRKKNINRNFELNISVTSIDSIL